MNVLRAVAGWFRRHWSWLKWLVAAAVLAVLFVRYRETFVGRSWGDIRWAYLAGALALCAGAMLLTFFRWYVLVWAQEFPFRLQDALRLGFIGYLFNFVAPGVVGGDLVKMALIVRQQQSRRMVAAATVLIDRVVGLLALLLIGGLAVLVPTPLVAHPAFKTGMAVFWIGSAAGLFALAVALHPALPRSRWLNRMVGWPLVGRPIGEMINALLLYQTRRGVILFTLALSLVSHFGLLTGFYLGALALHRPDAMPAFIEHLQMIPAAELVGVVIPLPGGSGALEAAVAELYRLAGAAPGDGLLTALAYRAVTIVIALVGAAYYFMARREIDRAIEEAQQAEADELPPASPTLDSLPRSDAARP